MTLQKIRTGDNLSVSIDGRLDTATAPNLDELLKEELPSTVFLEMDLKGTEYISSAGLRVLLETTKAMEEKKGSMDIKNANEQVMDIFRITGFDRILHIV